MEGNEASLKGNTRITFRSAIHNKLNEIIFNNLEMGREIEKSSLIKVLSASKMDKLLIFQDGNADQVEKYIENLKKNMKRKNIRNSESNQEDSLPTIKLDKHVPINLANCHKIEKPGEIYALNSDIKRILMLNPNETKKKLGKSNLINMPDPHSQILQQISEIKSPNLNKHNLSRTKLIESSSHKIIMGRTKIDTSRKAKLCKNENNLNSLFVSQTKIPINPKNDSKNRIKVFSIKLNPMESILGSYDKCELDEEKSFQIFYLKQHISNIVSKIQDLKLIFKNGLNIKFDEFKIKLNPNLKKEFNISLEQLCGMINFVSNIFIEKLGEKANFLGLKSLDNEFTKWKNVRNETLALQENVNLIFKCSDHFQICSDAYSAILNLSSIKILYMKEDFAYILNLFTKLRMMLNDIIEKYKLLENILLNLADKNDEFQTYKKMIKLPRNSKLQKCFSSSPANENSMQISQENSSDRIIERKKECESSRINKFVKKAIQKILPRRIEKVGNSQHNL